MECQRNFFVYKPLLKQFVYTKRGILGIVASIFDPLGILTPSILEAKSRAENAGWDDQIQTAQKRDGVIGIKY